MIYIVKKIEKWMKTELQKKIEVENIDILGL